MNRNISLNSKVVESRIQLSDPFVDYLDSVYFPGAIDVLDSETVSFEFDNFFNAYAK